MTTQVYYKELKTSFSPRFPGTSTKGIYLNGKEKQICSLHFTSTQRSEKCTVSNQADNVGMVPTPETVVGFQLGTTLLKILQPLIYLFIYL